MLIASYNPKNTGDTMVLIMNPDAAAQDVQFMIMLPEYFQLKIIKHWGTTF